MNRFLTLIFAVFMCMQVMAWSGNGSSETPYIISNKSDLETLRNNVNSSNRYAGVYFRLTSDLNLSGSEWVPIGRDGKYFNGIFDGNGYTISNIKVATSGNGEGEGYDWKGLFGEIGPNSIVKNLTVEDIDIRGRQYVGAIVGRSYGSIENCHVKSGHIRGWYQVGGLVGRTEKSSAVPSIINCSVSCNVYPRKKSDSGAGNANVDMGGIVGHVIGGLTISNCLFDGVLAAYKPGTSNPLKIVGGFIGYVKSGTVNATNLVFSGDFKRIISFTNETIQEIADINAAGGNTISANFGTLLGGAANTSCVFNCASLFIKDVYNVMPCDGKYNASIVSSTKYSEMQTNTYANVGYNTFLSAATMNSVDYSFKLNKTNPNYKAWAIENGKLKININNYTIKANLGTNVLSLSSLPAGYPSPYAKSNIDFEINVADISSIGYLACSINDNVEATQSSATQFVGQTQLLEPLISVGYKKVPTISNLASSFEALDKKMILNWNISGVSDSPTGKTSLWRKKNNEDYVYVTEFQSLPITTYEDSNIEFDASYNYQLRFTGTFQDREFMSNNVHYSNYQTLNSLPKTTTPTANISIIATPLAPDGINLSIRIPNHPNLSGATYNIIRENQPNLSYTFVYDASISTGTQTITYPDNRDMSDPCTAIPYTLELIPAQIVNGSSNVLAGLTYTSEQSVSFPYSTGYEINDGYKASKGEYNNVVKLIWSPYNPTNSELLYKIYRRVAETDGEFDLIASMISSDGEFVYNDEQVLSRVIYEYKIEMYSKCGGNYKETPTDFISDIGYCQVTGTISGQITYGSGTAVEGVDVFARNNSLFENETQFKSLELSGITDNKWYMGKAKEEQLFKSNNFSVQLYLRPSSFNSETSGVLNIYAHTQLNIQKVGDEYALQLVYIDDGVQKALTTDFTIPADIYRHISIVRNNNHYYIYVINDDDLGNIYVQSASAQLVAANLGNIPEPSENILDVLTNNDTAGYYFHIGTGFKGYIDELRIWSKALDTLNIKKYYNRMLAGNEANLKVYWTFDEGLKSRFFDVSKSNGLYNSNHGFLTEVNTSVSNVVPDEQTQLGLKGITDANGNYMISGIPYSGEGTSYSIVPIMGVHSFQPAEHLRYISQSSLIHNSTDFDDISSFEVSGRVTYANSNFPVEGANLLIDGSYAISNNQIVSTDADGNYTIDVPIGAHYISVYMMNHTFQDGGRYPADPENLVLKTVFNNPRSGINFVDQSLVRIAGRVVGGNIEGEKQLGFGFSSANIGAATIEMQAIGNNYFTNNMNIVSPDSLISSSATIQSGAENGRKITIVTDPETGEFLVELPPLQYRVTRINTNSVTSQMFGNLSEIVTPNINQKTEDSIINPNNENEYLKFMYHSRFDRIYKSDPIFEVKDNAHQTGAFGDNFYYVENGTDVDTLTLITYDENQNVNYLLQHPTFSMSKPYSFLLKAHEEYVNNDSDTPVVSLVPCAGAVVSIVNQIASSQITCDTEDLTAESNITMTPTGLDITLNNSGEAVYNFKAGFPNIVAPHTLTMDMVLDFGGSISNWSLNGNSQGIVLGGIPKSGNNFVTTGPDLIDFILHDPVGSGSYAYLEEGSTITNSYTQGKTYQENTSATFTSLLGLEVTTSTGVGFMVTLENDAVNTISAGFSNSYELDSSNTITSSVTLNQRIQTSSDPSFVGADADIFIGKSTNLIIGEMLNLGIFNSENIDNGILINDNYSLGAKDNLSLSTSFSTNFYYTQNHIVNALIPTLKNTRKSILQYVSTYADSVNYTAIENSIYLTTHPLTDEIWESNELLEEGVDYLWIAPTTISSSDQVATITNSIINWENRIRDNERIKVETYENTTPYNVIDMSSTLTSRIDGTSSGSYTAGFVGNTSIDAGTEIERSLERTTTEEANRSTSVFTSGTVNLITGFSINKAGFNFEAETENGGGKNTSLTNTFENTVAYGYVLNDSDADNYLTIDIHLPYDAEENKTIGGHSYMFRNRGGQSSCPYEGPTTTLYYEQGTELDPGAQQLDQPQLLLTSPAVVNQISAGREVGYSISIANANLEYDRTYVLSYDDNSNPNGLQITMDGSPLSIPRSFTVPAGESIPKTIRVRQTNTGILDYEGIRLVLASECGDIESEQFITAHFIPSSTDLLLSCNDLILNTSTSSSSVDTCRLIVSDFDRNFYGFAAIRYQYKATGDINWTTIKEYVADENLIPLTQNNELLPESAIVTFPFAMSNTSYPDGTYTFRAISVGKPGGANASEVIVSSNEIQVIKDKSRPKLFGNAMPTNGILTPDNEISVLFNEDIMNNRIVDDFFSVKAILNHSGIDDKIGIQFTGAAQIATQANIPLLNRSFSVETWFKRNPGEAGTIIAQGSTFSLGFNTENKVVLNIMGQTYTSTITNDDESWQYISFSFNNETHKLNVYSLFGEYANAIIADVDFPAEYTGNAELTIGANHDGSNAFTGVVNETTLWSYARNMSDLTDKNICKTGNEHGLIGYWQMNEGYGLTIMDKARSRHMYIPNENYWYLDTENIAVSFNGVNDVIEIEPKFVEQNESYAIEFWFKGEPQANATLFSCGNGINDSVVNNKLSLYFNDNQKLTLNTNGTSIIVNENNYLDNSWHHVALNVLRTGIASVYIDGTLTKQISANLIGGLLNGTYTIGACKYQTPENVLASNYTIDNYFAGSIDELRLWKSSITAKSLAQTMRSRLYGDEQGLVAYYPFENYVNNEIVGSLSDKINQADYTGIAAAGDAAGTYTFTTVAPALKEARPIENVNFEWIASNNKIVINLTEPIARIEGTTVELSVNNISDLNGNYQNEPIKWTAFIDLNRLKWSDNELNIEIEEGEGYSFQVAISNQSGREENWVISNIPTWLEISQTQGTLQPLASQILTFEISQDVNIGSYEEVLSLTGYYQIEEPFAVNLKVTAVRPDWSVDPNQFENNMNLIAQEYIENVPQTDEDDIIAAFVDGICVGLTSPNYIEVRDAYYTFMTIYGNADDENKNVSFKLWDAGTGRIYTVIETSQSVQFRSTSMIGSTETPVVLNALDVVSQNITLNRGWNWISTNMEFDSETDAYQQFKESLGNNGIIVKSPAEASLANYSQNNDDWFGNFSGINNETMYVVKVEENQILSFYGEQANAEEHSLDINNGWNYIGYLPQYNLPINTALADIEASDGDIIKAQSGFATYLSGNGWIGNLSYLQPGAGYMYKSLNSQDFSFSYPTVRAKDNEIETKEIVETYWTANTSAYASNMTITLIVKINNEEQRSESIEVGAFVDDECRGTVRLIYEASLDLYLGYLMVYGEAGNNVALRLYNHETNTEQEFVSYPQFAFVADAAFGTPDEPYSANFSTCVSSNDIHKTSMLSVYPNPTNDLVNIISDIAISSIEITDVAGRIIYKANPNSENAFIDLSNAASGIYFLNIIDERGFLSVEKITRE